MRLFDAIVRHQLFLEGLKNGRRDELKTKFIEVDKELRELLALVPFGNLAEMNKRQLRELVRGMREVMDKVFDPYVARMVQWFEFYMREDRQTMAQVFGQFSETVAPPEPARMWSTVVNAPMGANGLLMLVALGLSMGGTKSRIERTVTQGYVNAWTKEELAANIGGAQFMKGSELAKAFNGVNSTQNTIIQHIAAQSNFMVAKTAFDEYEWLSILDDGTTNICRSRSGNRYPFGKGPLPPAHVGCRSSIAPVVDGEVVPEEAYTRWLDTQPPALIHDIFGGAPKSFELIPSLTLEQFAAKRSLILS